MPSCAVRTCKYRISGKYKRPAGLIFFSFPHNKEIAEEWVKFCGNPNLKVSSSTVCSLHFDKSCFIEDWTDKIADSPNRCRKIRPDAIPTIRIRQPLEVTNINIVGQPTKSETMESLKMPGYNLPHTVIPSAPPFEKVFVKNPFFINFKDNSGAFLNEIRSQSQSYTPQIPNSDSNTSPPQNIYSGNAVENDSSKNNGTYTKSIVHDHTYIKAEVPELHNDNHTETNGPEFHNNHTMTNTPESHSDNLTNTNGPKLHNDKGNIFLTVNLSEYSKVIDIKRICGIVLVLDDEPTQNPENNAHTNVSHASDNEPILENDNGADPTDEVSENKSISRKYKTKLKEHFRINEKGEKEFQCPKCEKIYYAPRLLQKHFRKEHDTSYKYKCPRCPEVYKAFTVLKNHIKREHFFKCQFCENKFETPRQYKTHLKESHKEVPYNLCKPYFCETCDREFTNKNDFLKHLREHDGIVCGICAERFNSKEEFTTHEKEHPNKYFCDICNKGFKEKSSLKVHEAVHSDPMFTCNICQQRFKAKNSLRHHIAVIHNKLKRFMCDKCPTRFYNPSTLKNHQRIVHDKIRPFQCPLCDKKFAGNSNLQLHHRIIHLKLKPFQCEFCGRQFAKKDALVNHRHIHTGTPRKQRIRQKPVQRKRQPNRYNKNTPPVDCEICGKTLKNISCLKAHLNTHARIRKYKCNFCGLMFLHQTSKIRHEKAHEADPEHKFVCPICWRRMKTKEELDMHMTQHNNRLKRHKCEVCGEEFCRRLLLDNHMLLEHTNEEEIIKKEQEIDEVLQAVNNLL